MPMEFVSQNLLLISVAVMSGFGLLWPMLARSGKNEVSPAEATLLINRDDAHVLDVREVDEFVAGHLPDARNIPLSKLAERVGEQLAHVPRVEEDEQEAHGDGEQPDHGGVNPFQRRLKAGAAAQRPPQRQRAGHQQKRRQEHRHQRQHPAGDPVRLR